MQTWRESDTRNTAPAQDSVTAEPLKERRYSASAIFIGIIVALPILIAIFAVIARMSGTGTRPEAAPNSGSASARTAGTSENGPSERR